MTILLVDDNAAVLETYANFLDILNYDVIACSSPAEALSQFSEHDDITTVISDYHMPGMNGVELIRTLESEDHPIRKIVYTGGCPPNIPDDITLITKPFRIQQLVDEINH